MGGFVEIPNLGNLWRGLERRVSRLEAARARGIPVVTSLPTTNLIDGMEVDFVASPTLATVWRLRYNATSASAYKWEYRGGSPLYTGVPGLTAITTNATAFTFTTFASTGFTLPLAGEYDLTAAATYNPTNAQVVFFRMLVGAAGYPSGSSPATVGAGGWFPFGFPTVRATVAAASTAVVLQHASSGVSQAINVYDRRATAVPVRVG